MPQNLRQRLQLSCSVIDGCRRCFSRPNLRSRCSPCEPTTLPRPLATALPVGARSGPRPRGKRWCSSTNRTARKRSVHLRPRTSAAGRSSCFLSAETRRIKVSLGTAAPPPRTAVKSQPGWPSSVYVHQRPRGIDDVAPQLRNRPALYAILQILQSDDCQCRAATRTNSNTRPAARSKICPRGPASCRQGNSSR